MILFAYLGVLVCTGFAIYGILAFADDDITPSVW